MVNMASTGIAATLLSEGKTVHKAFSLPVPLYSDSVSGIDPAKCPAEIRNASIFIFDEAPMAQKYALQAMDTLLRQVRARQHPSFGEIPFGGLIVLCGGDFRFVFNVNIYDSRRH